MRKRRFGVDAPNFKHGLSNAAKGGSAPEWRTWSRMRERCANPNSDGYANYGGRGIKVCDRWSGPQGFVNFLSDMGPRPSPKHSIDRKDRNGDYSPGNCRWATALTQNRNRSCSIFVGVDGIQMPLIEACELAGLPYATVLKRLENGWEKDRAISTPVRRGNRSLQSKARAAGIPYDNVRARIRLGWSEEKALSTPVR